MRIPDEYTALNVSEILTEAFHLQMSFKKRIDDYAEWEKLRGSSKAQQIMQDEINKLIYLRNALQRFRQRHVGSSGNSSEENSSESSGEGYQFNSPSSSQEEDFEFGSAYNRNELEGSITVKRQQLKNSKIAFWFLVFLSFSGAGMAVGLGMEIASAGVFLGIITLALVYMAYWLHNHIKKLGSEIEIMEHKL